MRQTARPDVVTTTHDWTDNDPLSFSTVCALAEAVDTDVEELPLLRESIATDALDALFEPPGHPPRTNGSLAFEHADRRITIHTDGTIRVEPIRHRNRTSG